MQSSTSSIPFVLELITNNLDIISLLGAISLDVLSNVFAYFSIGSSDIKRTRLEVKEINAKSLVNMGSGMLLISLVTFRKNAKLRLRSWYKGGLKISIKSFFLVEVVLYSNYILIIYCIR